MAGGVCGGCVVKDLGDVVQVGFFYMRYVASSIAGVDLEKIAEAHRLASWPICGADGFVALPDAGRIYRNLSKLDKSSKAAEGQAVLSGGHMVCAEGVFIDERLWPYFVRRDQG